MRKIVLLIFILALGLTLAGCQTLGDRLDGKFEPAADQEISEETTEPVIETLEEEQKEIKSTAAYNNIFFTSTSYDPEGLNCYAVYWVHIPGDQKMDPVERNLKLLLAGPTERWAEQGYYSSIPAGVELNWVKVEGDVIYADFSEELSSGSGSCAITAARQQIIMTAKYAAIEHLAAYGNKEAGDLKVIISVAGQTENVLQP